MKKFAYIGSAFALPLFAAAQVDSLQELGSFIIDLINNVAVPLVFAIAFIVFIWGIFQYFIQGGHDEEAKDKGKSLMLWGLIGFFIMVSVWGLVNILTGTLNTDESIPELPEAPEVN
ncbi:MAG TPA: pilin [Candidatus Paceibacterota bacterium]|nr:pilin [Candidatus Paceibacterota bacterium]